MSARLKVTTNVTRTNRVLIRKGLTFVAVSGDIRLMGETVQVFVPLAFICFIKCRNECREKDVTKWLI